MQYIKFNIKQQMYKNSSESSCKHIKFIDDQKQNINLHVLNDFLDSNNVFEEECRVELYLNKHFKLKLLIIYF